MNKKMSRRSLLLGSVQIPLGGALALCLSSCGGESEESGQSVCADPETMSAAEESMRASLGYTPESPDPAQNCAGCTYFTAGDGGCGACDLLGGAQVNASGRCNSWSSSGD